MSRVWPGMDADFTRQAAAIAQTEEGRAVAATLSLGDPASGRVRPLGPPLRLRSGVRAELAGLAAACHRVLEAILAAYDHDARLRDVLALPEAFREQVAAAHDGSVHAMRLDVLPHPDGGLRILETNANGPGGLAVSGRGRAAWRPLLARHGLGALPSLPSDASDWPGRWLTAAAERHTGDRPHTVALLYLKPADRNGVQSYDDGLTALGVRVLHGDPRDLEPGPDGGVTLHGEPVRHAYVKIGSQSLLGIVEQAETFLSAVRRGALFVQNGVRGRLLGDNKLCLAVVSDPGFAHLFAPADLRVVGPAVPWSRNLARCDGATVRRVLRDPDGYVLKRPLDARGNGVVIGRETSNPAVWGSAVDRAAAEGWLVQAYVPGPRLGTDSPDTAPRHDVALGVVEGRLAGAFARTGHDERLNASLSGRLHPLYV